MKKATKRQTRIHNTRLILKTIYTEGAISRAAVARATGLTRPTVSDAVSRLMGDSLVTEVGRGPSTGGKTPTLLSVIDNSRHLIGIDLAGNSVFRGAVVDLRGNILFRASVPWGGETGETALNQIYVLIDDLVAQATSPLLGIGVGSPGLIDTINGLVHRSVNLGWQDVPLRDLLSTRYPKPIYIANDSHVTALAEYTFGAHSTSPNLIVIKVGRGIGAGIITNSNLYYGDGFGAGEIGHVVVIEDGELCTCGNYGCLETVAGVPAILRRAQEIAASNPASQLAAAPVLDWDAIVDAFNSGDAAAVGLVTEVGRSLGVAVANLIGCFNIYHIVISGRIASFGDALLDAICAEAQRRILPSMAVETVVNYAALGADIGILGSAAMLLKHELDII